MRLTGIGSQYLIAMRDADGEFLDGARDYRLTLPAGHPGEPLLVGDPLRPPDPLDAADRPADAPASAASPAPSRPNPDGSTDLYFGPHGAGRQEHNWLQTVPGKGWFVILRLYSPLQPFFDKTWRPSEIEPYA